MDTGHGRRARRTTKVTAVPAWVTFASAAQVTQIRRTTTRQGAKSVEVLDVITSTLTLEEREPNPSRQPVSASVRLDRKSGPSPERGGGGPPVNENRARLTPATIAHRLGRLRMFFVRIQDWAGTGPQPGCRCSRVTCPARTTRCPAPSTPPPRQLFRAGQADRRLLVRVTVEVLLGWRETKTHPTSSPSLEPAPASRRANFVERPDASGSDQQIA